MDNYKTLLEKKEYDLLLSLTEGDLSPAGLSYRASAYLAKGDAKQALNILNAHRDELFKVSPLKTMRSIFELRFILKEFEEAYDDLEYFENLPYVSQEVEEYLHALPKMIRTEERNSHLSEKFTEEEIIEKLSEKSDDYEIISTLNMIGPLKVKDYIPSLVALVGSQKSSIVRTYALMYLISARYDKEITFIKNGQFFKLIPSSTIPPFTGKAFEDFRVKLDEEINDPSVSNIAKKLLNDYIFELFPEEVPLETEGALYFVAFSALAHEYLSSDFDLVKECEEKGVRLEEAKALIEKVKEVRKAESTLHY
ncbi:MAG: hypothetical protein K6G74_03590 [Bacilli bacterium]|nr:hypothetical protein [Bacilli bacterium]